MRVICFLSLSNTTPSVTYKLNLQSCPNFYKIYRAMCFVRVVLGMQYVTIKLLISKRRT